MSALLGGRYRLGELLGSGGTADVYAAWDEVLDRPVAVKWARAADDRCVRVQARAAGQVVHPRLVRVLDLGSTGGCDWAVLDLVEGASARALLDRGLPPSPAEAVAAAVGALDGLAYLHGLGLAHHDVSPGNLLVPDRSGRPCWAQVRLTDLGEPVAVEGHVVVSPHYVAPEVARGLAGDARADLYALGATLVHLLTGAPPYEHDDPDQVLAAHVRDPVVTPSARVPGLPAALDDVVRTALAKQPADRFADAGAMSAALRAVRFDPRPDAMPVLRPPVVLDVHTRPLRPLVPTAPRTGEQAGSAPDPGPGGPERSGRPAPAPVARPVPVGALLLALVAVGTATGVALMRPVAPAAAPTAMVRSTAATGPVVAPSAQISDLPAVTVVVPDLVGVGLDEARARLGGLGLLVADPQVQDGPQPAGTVLATRPAPGSVTAPGGTVQLDVASGANLVPAIAGLDAATAVRRLTEAGLVAVGVPETGAGTGTGAGAVTGSWPAAGSTVGVGTAVRVLLAAASTASGTPDPAPGPSGGGAPPTTGPTPTPTATLAAGPSSPAPAGP